MDAKLLEIAGQVAGIGGLALGVLLIVFRDIIRKNIFPKLPPPAQAYRLLRCNCSRFFRQGLAVEG